MISTLQSHPVNDASSSHCVTLPPYIYSPSEIHDSQSNAMYPHLYAGSPSPSYIHPGYEQYYKESWSASAPSNPWIYGPPRRSSSLPESAVNPKMTILPSQRALASDINTPSSTSSHSILTPSSPFAQHDVDEAEFESMEFDEFEYADEEDCLDSDFVEDMEGIDEADQELSPLYGASVPHAIKSTSALEGALGETPSSSYSSNLGVSSPTDRRLSASVPGSYPSGSHRSSAVSTQLRATEKEPPLSPPNSLPVTSYPLPHMYTHHNYSSSTSSFSPIPSPSLYHQLSSSSFAGAIVSPTSYSSRPTPNRLPILQPQPIRPIPPIPLADFAVSAMEIGKPEPCGESHSSQPLQALSPLPLLCQPVSDAIRYQLKEPPTSGAHDAIRYDEDLVAATECGRFAQEGLTFSQEHQSSGGICSVEGKICSCGCMGFPMRWRWR